jgi:hypothetical protein
MITRKRLKNFLTFWAPMTLAEFDAKDNPTQELAKEFADLDSTLSSLHDDALAQIITEFKDDLDATSSSISEMRSRAAQLLTASGFVAVLATIGTALPSKLAGVILTCLAVAAALYALVGTMWLTTQALAVRKWNILQLAPTADLSARRIREIYASKLYQVRRSNGIRLEVPVGYLRDAYWYFFATVILFVLDVILRYLPFAHA